MHTISYSRFVLPWALIATACGATTTRADDSAMSAASTWTCEKATLRVEDEAPGVMQRLFVELPDGSSSKPFVLDTGSATSFRFRDEAARSRPASCAAAAFPILSGPTGLTTPDGIPVAGILGSDLLSDGAFDLRIGEGTFAWTRTPPALGPAAVTLPVTFHRSPDPYASNMLTARGISLDGSDVELLVDTGSPNVLILSQTPRPDETLLEAEDGNGNPIKLYVSTVEIAFGDQPPRKITVERAAHFPTLEKTFAAIGGRVSGILGLSALGHEHVVLSRSSMSFIPSPR